MPDFSLDFGRLGFLTFIIAFIINIGLGLSLVRHGRKHISHKFFLTFLSIQNIWLIIMYTSVRAPEKYLLLMARIAMFFGALDALFLFLFVYTFQKQKISKKFLWIVSSMAAIVAVLTLSPFVFSHLVSNAMGEYAPKAGIGIIAFTLFVGFCVLETFYICLRRYFNSQGEDKLHWRYISIGLIVTYSLVMGFDLFYYNLPNNLNVIRLNHLYVLPFLLSASYVLLKYHFLNIRIFAAELFAFLIIGVSG